MQRIIASTRGAILFGGVIAPVLLMVGLARTPAASASLLLNLEGVLTAGRSGMVRVSGEF
jgi:drug/metabolite transporter (DMT)-like permease